VGTVVGEEMYPSAGTTNRVVADSVTTAASRTTLAIKEGDKTTGTREIIGTKEVAAAAVVAIVTSAITAAMAEETRGAGAGAGAGAACLTAWAAPRPSGQRLSARVSWCVIELLDSDVVRSVCCVFALSRTPLVG
jgi:hypothetical protein